MSAINGWNNLMIKMPNSNGAVDSVDKKWWIAELWS